MSAVLHRPYLAAAKVVVVVVAIIDIHLLQADMVRHHRRLSECRDPLVDLIGEAISHPIRGRNQDLG